jgi:alkanesulfonate monooxygenase SsuD/methylene tetrahydromethanopterin reductase-like flavin-dependent oxidoreductase (luciferase family)
VRSLARAVYSLASVGDPTTTRASNYAFHERGGLFDRQLAEMRRVWDQHPRGFADPVGPSPVHSGGPPLLLGGTSAAALRRMTECGVGWISGGGGPPMFAASADRARTAWRDADRDGEPRLAALAYVSLGDDGEGHARRYLTDYCGFLGDIAERIVAGTPTSAPAVRDTVTAIEDAGCDELILFPCNADLARVGLIAEATLR